MMTAARPFILPVNFLLKYDLTSALLNPLNIKNSEVTELSELNAMM